MSADWSDGLVNQIADRVCDRLKSVIAFEDRIFADRLTFDEAEAAEILGVPKHVLKGCRERGEIKPRKVGKGWRYSRSLLCEYANQP